MSLSKWVLVLILLAVGIFLLMGYAQTPEKIPGKAPEGMAAIPGGTFWMGCVAGDSSCNKMESPRHKVTLKPFFMDVFEVTQAQYEKATGLSPMDVIEVAPAQPEKATGTNPSLIKNCPNCPVEGVSWNEAQSYCRKVGKHLPTEAQWEYAARGGKDGQVRYGDIDAVAWYHANSGNKTHPVGQKQANGYGLFDMLGNVGEWCMDWYGEYSSSPSNNPAGPSSGSTRVLRGGSWNLDPSSLRASYRDLPSSGNWYYPVGFRCVQE